MFLHKPHRLTYGLIGTLLLSANGLAEETDPLRVDGVYRVQPSLERAAYELVDPQDVRERPPKG